MRAKTGSALGGAAERTDLAWVRSALAFGAVGAAMLKSFAPLGRARPVDGIAALALAAAVVLLAAGYLIRRNREELPARRSIVLVSVGTVAVGLAAIVIGSTSS
ncbi:MAG: DUF202 domain-containing protein [Acidimicrobiales bacterium]